MSEFRRPIDGAYAFRLRPTAPADKPGRASQLCAMGQVLSSADVAKRALVAGDADRFIARIQAWGGPEDVVEDGSQPFVATQDRLQLVPWKDRFTLDELDDVLAGTVHIMRHPDVADRTDYIMRDHHMLDAVLYHYAATATLPTCLFHADRHSDWCRDGYLNARVPAQAATWWTLLEGLKRPGTEAPVLGEEDVVFTTAQPGPEVALAGRDVGASVRVPWWVNKSDLPWPRALNSPHLDRCDWVSLDLDYFQPLEQLRLTKGLLRDGRFHKLMQNAKVRVFVLSPQFTAGGDVLEHWTVAGRVHASLRMLNLVRSIGLRKPGH